MARQFGFGYLKPPEDARNHRYLATRAMDQIYELGGAPEPRKNPYREGPILDQENKPHCVGFSCRGFLNAAPIMTKPGELWDASAIYRRAQQIDEWAGENYDGTSVNAGMKVLLELGYISSYVWFTNISQIINWCNGGYGTVVVGTNWYARMDSVRRDGFIEGPSSLNTPIGGHAYRINWYDAKKKGFLVVNSWGRDWGQLGSTCEMMGTAYLSESLAQRLFFKEDGEVAAATQVLIRPTKL